MVLAGKKCDHHIIIIIIILKMAPAPYPSLQTTEYMNVLLHCKVRSQRLCTGGFTLV